MNLSDIWEAKSQRDPGLTGWMRERRQIIPDGHVRVSGVAPCIHGSWERAGHKFGGEGSNDLDILYGEGTSNVFFN